MSLLEPLAKFEWTPERVDELKKLRGENLPASKIATQMGVSRNSVLGKLHRMGVGGPEAQDLWTEAEIETLKIYWASGLSVREVQGVLVRKHNFYRTTLAISAKAYRIGLSKRMERRRYRERSRYAFEETPEPTIQENAPLHIGFMDLDSFHCREVTGRGEDGLAVYCGHPKDGDHSFCAFHQRRNYYKPNYDLRRLRGF